MHKGEPTCLRWVPLLYNQFRMGLFSEVQLYAGVAVGLSGGVGVDAAGG